MCVCAFDIELQGIILADNIKGSFDLSKVFQYFVTSAASIDGVVGTSASTTNESNVEKVTEKSSPAEPKSIMEVYHNHKPSKKKKVYIHFTHLSD